MDAETLQEIAVTYMDDTSPHGEAIRKLTAEVEFSWQVRAVQIRQIAAQAQQITELMAEVKRLQGAIVQAVGTPHLSICGTELGGHCDCGLADSMKTILREAKG